jgi:hypothetical protein
MEVCFWDILVKLSRNIGDKCNNSGKGGRAEKRGWIVKTGKAIRLAHAKGGE